MRHVLIIGCGLLGTSMALSLQKTFNDYVIDGYEPNQAHRLAADKLNAFHQWLPTLHEEPNSYDVVILAAPILASCELLESASRLGQMIMDICSVKVPICQRAEQLGLRHRFVPSHPMAGKSSEGPSAASADLFQNQPWIYLEGWNAIHEIIPIIKATGARTVSMESAEQHDEAMASISHGIHVLSLTGILAYQESIQNGSPAWHHITGPAFRDITRLASSPAKFWSETLISNRFAVIEQIDRFIEILTQFRTSIDRSDDEKLSDLLTNARKIRMEWQEANQNANHNH